MNTETTVTELSPSDRVLLRVDETFFKFEKLMALLASIVIMGIMFIGVFQVIGRRFNLPVPGYVDVIEMLMTIFAFVAISYTQRLGGHVRMEIILAKLKGRTLYGMEIFGTLVAMAVVAILMYFGYDHFLRAWEIGDSTIDIQLPIWPSKLLVPFAFLLLMVRLSLQLWGFVRLFLDPNTVEIAVPHIETVDEQAQAEIDAGLAGEAEKVNLLHEVNPGIDSGATR